MLVNTACVAHAVDRYMYLGPESLNSIFHFSPLLGVQHSRGNLFKVCSRQQVTEALAAIVPVHISTIILCTLYVHVYRIRVLWVWTPPQDLRMTVLGELCRVPCPSVCLALPCLAFLSITYIYAQLVEYSMKWGSSNEWGIFCHSKCHVGVTSLHSTIPWSRRGISNEIESGSECLLRHFSGGMQ